MIEPFRPEINLQIAEHVANHKTKENDAGDGHQNLLTQRRADETYGLTHGPFATPCLDSSDKRARPALRARTEPTPVIENSQRFCEIFPKLR